MMRVSRGLSPAPVRWRTAGLTLIELLITLALVALLTAVLMQAMGQVRKVEVLLDSGRIGQQAQYLRAEWLRSAVESALPMPAGSPDQYSGSERQATWVSTQLPGLEPGVIGRLRLQLVYDEAADRTQLQARVEAGEKPQGNWTVQSWPGRKGRLQYIDARGEWQAQWPPLALEYRPLPRALVLDPDDGLTPTVVLAHVVGPQAEASRRALEGL